MDGDQKLVNAQIPLKTDLEKDSQLQDKGFIVPNYGSDPRYRSLFSSGETAIRRDRENTAACKVKEGASIDESLVYDTALNERKRSSAYSKRKDTTPVDHNPTPIQEVEEVTQTNFKKSQSGKSSDIIMSKLKVYQSSNQEEKEEPVIKAPEQSIEEEKEQSGVKVLDCNHKVSIEKLREVYRIALPSLKEIKLTKSKMVLIKGQFRLIKCPEIECFNLLPQSQKDIEELFTAQEIKESAKNKVVARLKNHCILCSRKFLPLKGLHNPHKFCPSCFEGVKRYRQKKIRGLNRCMVPGCQYKPKKRGFGCFK